MSGYTNIIVRFAGTLEEFSEAIKAKEDDVVEQIGPKYFIYVDSECGLNDNKDKIMALSRQLNCLSIHCIYMTMGGYWK